MLLQKFAEKPQSLLRTGLFFLILASFANYFLPRLPSLPEAYADGGLGLLYGLAFGLLLLGIRRRSRARHWPSDT
jgi:hypothetical protein